MGNIKLPSIKDIMAERRCSRNRAVSLRALFEVRADEEYARLTGRHFLETVKAGDLMRDASLASR